MAAGRRLLAVGFSLAAIATSGVAYRDVRAETERAPAPASSARPVPSATPSTAPSATPAPSPTPISAPDTRTLEASLGSIIAGSGAEVSLSFVDPATSAQVSIDGGAPWVAASTYKLPLLMDETDLIANGTASSNDVLCFTDADYEDGYFDDYADGDCFTRDVLMQRVGKESDNTAAHILVRYLGGAGPLNAFAAANGATSSGFYDPNQTTAADLSALLLHERTAPAAAQAELRALLTHTLYESGVPAGVPATATVIHKVGMLDAVTNDAALVLGPRPYVLAVLVDGLDRDAGWSLIARLSAAVWQWEAST
ncbi:MAG TPA: serine hydrolase [Candidatus Dormibacteraeota bacterium]